MGNWIEAVMFGVALLAFVLGISNVIMAAMAPQAEGQEATKERVEQIFFGISGIVLCVLFSYGIASL